MKTTRLRGLAVAACALGGAALLGLLLAGPGYRFGLWHFSLSFKVMQYAAYAGSAAFAVSLLALILGRRHSLPWAALGLLLGGVAGGFPAAQYQKVRSLPYIHDISTDTQNPPEFAAVLPLRAGAPNPAVYAGAELAAQQAAAYPDIQPLVLELAPAAAFERALATARRLGWEIVATDADGGRIEATDTTFWFGFKDDVVVRVAPADGGSRIDVRSLSRIGKSDVGANAARIRRYLAAVQAAAG